MKHREQEPQGCEVPTGQFAWWTQVCGIIATHEIEDEFGTKHPVCEDHYKEVMSEPA